MTAHDVRRRTHSRAICAQRVNPNRLETFRRSFRCLFDTLRDSWLHPSSMTLLLTNEEIESIFTIDECFDILEPALAELGNGRAVNMPRQDLLVPGPIQSSYHG